MKLIKFMAIIMLTLFLCIGCGSSKKKSNAPKKIFSPDWYGIQDNSGEYLYSFGTGTKMTKTLATDAAVASAYLEAANYVQTQVKGMIKDFEQQSGIGENSELTSLTSRVVKTVTNAKFKGSIISKREAYALENNKFQSFIRLSIPKEEINRRVIDSIKKEEALYNEFKASQSFKELDKELGSE